MSFYNIRKWNMQNMPWLYTVEQGKNTDRSDASDLWFHFPFLDMNFSALNFKAHKNFVLVTLCNGLDAQIKPCKF